MLVKHPLFARNLSSFKIATEFVNNKEIYKIFPIESAMTVRVERPCRRFSRERLVASQA